MVARLLGKPRQRDVQRGHAARCAVGVDRVEHVLQFDLHLSQGVFCVARSVGEAALDPIARGDRMRNAVHHG
jgi:hypothetical protein